MSNGSLPAQSRPTWTNWTQNIVHEPPADGSNYYFAPNNLSELKAVLQQAVTDKAVLRVSGQRHSQPPLVISANAVAPGARNYLVDMSCYADLGPNGDQTMVVDVANKKITVNTGVREDQVDALLTQNNLMMRTVTAGGFFSIGGMTSVDVHGATIAAPIFAGTVSAFTILRADGSVVTIDETTPAVNGWKPIQFARVNLGGLGIVTSVTIDVLDRPYATTLLGGSTSFSPTTRSQFATEMQTMLTTHDRVETFYNPYAIWPYLWPFSEYYAAWWDVVANPSNQVPNKPVPAQSACTLASQDEYGAPLLPGEKEKIAEEIAISAQGDKIGAGTVTVAGVVTISTSVDTANANYSDLWLTEAARVMFMSYFIELPAIDANGLGKVWDSLQVVGKPMQTGSSFYIAAPMEFRFVTGSDVAMAGTYTTNPNAIFVNLDLIGFIKATPTSEYPPALLQFFADVEREWVAMGGFPHNGKMYGFYDPKGAPRNYSAAFNVNFLADLRARRGAPLQAFRAYRQTQDPNGLFYNDFLRALLG
jgi:FAD/FMN-containing dehydrogenase